MRDKGARISEGKRFPLSLSLSRECGSSCTQRYDRLCVFGCVLVALIARTLRRRRAWVSRGTLCRKPSRLAPKSEALAGRSCRTAVLPGTAVERRTRPHAIKPNLGVPLFSCVVGGGTCPDPMAGHPLHSIRRTGWSRARQDRHALHQYGRYLFIPLYIPLLRTQAHGRHKHQYGL